MLKDQRILLLSLYTFGLTGGIEKVCSAVTKVLDELKANNAIGDYECFSMYDHTFDLRYTRGKYFTAFKGNRRQFGLRTIKSSLKYNTIILSHVNLLFFGWLISKLNPRARIILFAHGIEIWKPLSTWKKRFLQRKAEIWAVSNYTSEIIKEQHAIPANRVKVIHNCLDPFFQIPETFNKPASLLERYGLSPEKKILFTLSRLSSKEKYKGYDQVLAAIKELPEHVHYILSGKADEEEQARIEQLIWNYQLQDRVTLTGFIADDEIASHFLLADLFVMPSKAEGFGISFIEAGACGCRVIAGNKDGSREALLNGELGMLIDPADSAQLQSAILKALQSTHNSALQQEKTVNSFGFPIYQNNLHKLLLNS